MLSPEVIEGLGTLGELMGTPILTSVVAMASVFQAVLAKRWSTEAEQGLAIIQQQAERLRTQPESSLADRAVFTAMLAVARVGQQNAISASPRPEVRATAAGPPT
jgi:hypothetical protein